MQHFKQDLGDLQLIPGCITSLSQSKTAIINCYGWGLFLNTISAYTQQMVFLYHVVVPLLNSFVDQPLPQDSHHHQGN